MRVLWVRLKDFRGTGERKIAFPDRGVTVVEGPNEVGKSSIAEALDLLFTQYDSTRKTSVLSVQPVDKDAGPEIEAEIETGPYRMCYFKRFLKQPETVLEVRSPEPLSFRGREAHDRARAILDETMDQHLWSALRVQQGTAVDQAHLADAPSLARALDRTAGQETAGDRELTLFDRVREEYERYFTGTDRPKKNVKGVLTHAHGAAAKVAELEGDWQALERDVERSAELERAVPELERAVKERREELERLREEVRELEKRAVTGPVEINLRMARVNEGNARKERDDRATLLERVKGTARRREELEAGAALGAPALEAAVAAASAAREMLAEAEEQAARADKLCELRERDLNYQHFRLDLEQLGERESRVRTAQEEAAAARGFLEKTRITDDRLHRIRDAHLALAEAQARLDAKSPRLSLRALRAIELELDGERRRVDADESLDRRVASSLAMSVPGWMELEVNAGSGEFLLARDRARRELDSLLGEARLATLEEAEEENGLRRDAERTVAEREKKIGENLRDLSPEELRAKIERLEAMVRKYPEERTGMPAIAPDYEKAKAAKTAAKEALDKAAREFREARARHAAADKEERRLKEQVAGTDGELRLAREAERHAESDLGEARRKRPDLALEVALQDAEDELRAAREAFEAARRAVEELRRSRERAAAAAKAVEESEAGLRAGQDELRDVTARLELLGERGLFEELETARTILARAEHERSAVERRSAAARLLFSTMGGKREAARRAYAAPLRDRILRLGRIVFGESFGVELDEELRVRSRTLDGKTLAWDQLSVGAREQIGLLARLACALLVDEADGVPLVFDDTLGHTDPRRLERMGATLRQAGEKCQVILLTCTPGRFSHIEDAHRVQLAPGG